MCVWCINVCAFEYLNRMLVPTEYQTHSAQPRLYIGRTVLAQYLSGAQPSRWTATLLRVTGVHEKYIDSPAPHPRGGSIHDCSATSTAGSEPDSRPVDAAVGTDDSVMRVSTPSQTLTQTPGRVFPSFGIYEIATQTVGQDAIGEKENGIIVGGKRREACENEEEVKRHHHGREGKRKARATPCDKAELKIKNNGEKILDCEAAGSCGGTTKRCCMKSLCINRILEDDVHFS